MRPRSLIAAFGLLAATLVLIGVMPSIAQSSREQNKSQPFNPSALLPWTSLGTSGARETSEQQNPLPVVLPRGKKLFLTDGTFHLVRNYERQGDRVRYYSTERSQWEEIPASLVDWEATKKAEAEDAQRVAQIEARKRELEKARITEELDVDASLEVAPGVYLPDAPGLYVIEGRSTRTMTQSGVDVKLDKGRLVTQILIPIPVIPSRHKVQLVGAHAAFRLTIAQPEFYIRTTDDHEPDLELLRATVKGNSRLIEYISTNIVGQQNRDRKAVSVERWLVAKGVYRLTLSQSLEPGEYALAEVLQGEEINLGVWDFGVDPPSALDKKPSANPKK